MGQGRAGQGKAGQGRAGQGQGQGQGQGARGLRKKAKKTKIVNASRTGLEPPRSLKSARGPKWPSGSRLSGLGFRAGDQYWSPAEPAPLPGLSWVLPSPGCGEAGERVGLLCAIEVEGLKRRGRPRP